MNITIKELRLKSNKELVKMLQELRGTRRELHFKAASRQLKNVREIRKTKRTISQILTLLKDKKNQVETVSKTSINS